MMNKIKQLQKKKDKEWADQIKQRDKSCVVCREKNRLNAHHILPRELKKYRYELWNGVSLCPKHHKFSREMSAHNNPLCFMIWLSKNRPQQFCEVVNNAEKINARIQKMSNLA